MSWLEVRMEPMARVMSMGTEINGCDGGEGYHLRR